MTKEFIGAIVSGLNVKAEKIFKDVISSKVGDALETKRKEISKFFVSNTGKTEADENT